MTRQLVSRRNLLRTGALLPFGLAARPASAQTRPRTPPPYTLSINIEIMFRALNLSKADRIRAVAAQGFKAYSFWTATEDERKAMLQAQKQTGLTCVSIVGTGAAGGVTITLEPLSVNPDQPRRALDRAVDCFPVIAEVNHANVKVCFDFYHLQRTEGNLTINLREGLAKGLIKVVQIGDNPGRLEPGTGEINYPFLFAELRRLNYRGYVDTEMGTSSTPEHAMQVARRMSEEN